jgi:hypothetical protein
MNNPFLYSTGLLVVMTAAFLMAATAQENSSTVLNNASQEDSDLNNESPNLSISNNTNMNDAILNATNFTGENSTNNVAFMIGNDAGVRQTNSSRIHILGKDPENQAPVMSAFMIKGYVHPIRNAAYDGQYSLNAAGLSRGVEGTPHGYVTYYN